MAWRQPGWQIELWGNRSGIGLDINGGTVFMVCLQWVKPRFLRWRFGLTERG